MGNDSNTFFNIIAILGALAWLPYIIQLVREKFKKTKLKIISEDQIEIGYTTLGPILNISLAFLGQNKNSLIDKIELQLIHKSQEVQNFLWIWFEESLLQVDLPKLPINYKKNQKAIALNVLVDSLVEKKIGFQNIEFKKQSDEIIKLVTEDLLNLKNSSKKIEELKSYANYNKALEFSENSFSWKVGIYQANFKVYISSDNKSFNHSFKFKLSNLDIRALHKNLETIKLSVENAFITQDEELLPKWEWVYVNKLSVAEEIKSDFMIS